MCSLTPVTVCARVPLATCGDDVFLACSREGSLPQTRSLVVPPCCSPTAPSHLGPALILGVPLPRAPGVLRAAPPPSAAAGHAHTHRDHTEAHQLLRSFCEAFPDRTIFFTKRLMVVALTRLEVACSTRWTTLLLSLGCCVRECCA